jgi:pyridoxal phosphate enzyme (YggS family)
MDVRSNLEVVKDRILRAAERAGRNPADIRLVAVTKQVEPERIIQAAQAGVRIFGENYAQELRDKYEAVERSVEEEVEWHFIGRLQRNKVKYLIGRVKLIHSLDSVSVAEEINKRAKKAGIKMPVLIEVDAAQEESKGGIKAADAGDFINGLAGLSSIEIRGLMTIPPYFDEPELARPYFRKLRELRDELKNKFPLVEELSMGMSGDFEVAIEEGATLVRVGSAIFGPRPQ